MALLQRLLHQFSAGCEGSGRHLRDLIQGGTKMGCRLLMGMLCLALWAQAMKATTKHTRSGHYSQAPQAKVARAAGPHDSHLARTAPARSQLSVTNAMATMQRMLVHTSESLERSIKMHGQIMVQSANSNWVQPLGTMYCVEVVACDSLAMAIACSTPFASA